MSVRDKRESMRVRESVREICRESDFEGLRERVSEFVGFRERVSERVNVRQRDKGRERERESRKI